MDKTLVKLGDVCNIQSGGTPSRQKQEYWENGSIPWIKISDFTGKFLNSSEEKITKKGLDNSSAKMFYKGTILYSIYATLGEVTILDIDATTNQAIVGLTIKDNNILKDYLYYCLMSLKNYVNLIGRGATQNNINMNILRNIEIPIVSIDQQHKIVATLDQVNDLISLKNQQLEQLDLLIKSRFVEMFGDPVKNEKGWETKELQFVSKVGSSKRFYQEELSISGVPFLKIADILNRIDNKETEANTYISEEQYLELLKLNLVPKENDVLVTSRGTIGKCYIVSKNDKFYFQDGMITWLSNFAKYLSPIFIFYSFMMNGIRNQINSMQAGSTVAYLSIAMIKKLNIMLPPLALQNQFADFVTEVEKQKSTVKQSLEQLETLKKKLMQDYFG